jgi:hypothetical protein
MKKRIFTLVFLIIALLSTTAMAQELGCAYYFFGEGCLGCEASNSYIKDLKVKYPDLQVDMYEVYFKPVNADLLKNYFTAYSIAEKDQGLPALFLPDSYFVGAKPIQSLTESTILDNTYTGCPTLLPQQAIGVVGQNFPLDIIKTLSFSRVTAGALYDAFHPGMLALVLIFLSLMMFIRSKKLLIKTGIRFIATVYVVYFLFSIGLLTWFASTPFAVFFYRLVGLFGVIYGVVIIKNYFGKWKMFQHYEKLRKTWYGAISKLLSSWGIIIFAGILSLFSFAKVGSTLLSLRFAFKGPSGWLALPITLYYLLIVVLPLILVLIVLFLTKQKLHRHAEKKGEEHAEKWKKHHHNNMNLIVGVITLLLGIMVLFI